MKTQCPKCGAKYEIPDERIPEKGLPTRCAMCDQIFRVHLSFPSPPPDPIEDDPPAKAPAVRKTTVGDILNEMPEEKEKPPHKPEPPAKAEVKYEPDDDEYDIPDPSPAVEPDPVAPPNIKAETKAALPEPSPAPIPDDEYDLPEQESDPPSYQAPRYDIPKEKDDDLDDILDDDFSIIHQPGPKIFVAVVVILLLIGMIWMIIKVAGEVDETYEATRDREVYTDAEMLKRAFSPEKIYRKAVELHRQGGPLNSSIAKSLFKQSMSMDENNISATARYLEIDVIAALDTGAKQDVIDKTKTACDEHKEFFAEEKNLLNPNVLRAKSGCLALDGQTKPALAAASSAIAFEDDDPEQDAEAYLMVAFIHLKTKQREKAFVTLENSVKKYGDLFAARHMLAGFYAEKSDFEKAVIHERAAVQINPEHDVAKARLAEYESQLSEEQKVMEDETSFDTLIEATKKLRSEGRHSEAMVKLNKAIELKPKSTMALMMKTKWLVDSNPAAALSSARRASAAGSVEAYYWMGSIQQAQGNIQGAISSYQTYLASAPSGSHSYEVKSILKNLQKPPEED